MADTISKTFSITIKFNRDDGEDLAADFLTYNQLKSEVKKAISGVVSASKGIVSAHIVGSVSEV